MSRSARALSLALVALTACAEPVVRTATVSEEAFPPVRIAVKGDWGAGTRAQEQVTARMCARRETAPFSFVITTGDNFYDPDGTATGTNYGRPEACLTADPQHEWRATWGNHDLAGSDTREVLGARRTYHWRLPGIDVFMLDSNRASSSTQRAWLRDELAASEGPVRIAVFHHPPYSAGSSHPGDAAVRSNWVPLFERYGVDLVLSGHAHLYERHRVDGIDYVVTGGGGRALHRCARNPRTLRICRAVYHMVELVVDERTIRVRAIKRDGTVFHSFLIDA